MSPFNQFLLTLAQLLLIGALPIITAAVYQHLRAATARLKSQLSQEQQDAIDKVISTAVSAAEQTGLLQKLVGPEKKDFAIQMAQSFLSKRGIDLDLESMANLIEAEVHNQQDGSGTSTENTMSNRQMLISGAVEAAVMAAEQSGLKGLIQNIGTEKKSYAVGMATRLLVTNGIDVDRDTLDALIEAQLMRLFLAARGQLPG